MAALTECVPNEGIPDELEFKTMSPTNNFRKKLRGHSYFNDSAFNYMNTLMTFRLHVLPLVIEKTTIL